MTAFQEPGAAAADTNGRGIDVPLTEPLAEGSALLVVKRGPNAGSRFLLERDRTEAGRHPDSHILLDDVTVSRRHADFVRDRSGGFVVRDVGSLNGTYVNGQRIDEATLTGGDEVQIGKYRLAFYSGQGHTEYAGAGASADDLVDPQ
ncbi:MAG: FHA domain-containing protein [Mycobacteriales bacterium]